MHPTVLPHASPLTLCSFFVTLALMSPSTTARAEAPRPPLDAAMSTPEPPPAYAQPGAELEIRDLSRAQRLSIERGAADLGGATEQSLLAVSLYLFSAATLISGVASVTVLFAEFAPMNLSGRGGWGAAEWGIVGSAAASFLVHAVTTPLAIMVGLAAQRRHERARDELLLTHIAITPFGAVLAGRF